MSRSLTALALVFVLLVQTTGSAWASVMDCCDEGFAACHSNPASGSCAFCAAVVPAALESGGRVYDTEHGRSPSIPVDATPSLFAAVIWRPPIG